MGGPNYAKCGLEPSVAHPPLPLQLFLPLQPLSLALQPPWPLQSFLPLQECLDLSSVWEEMSRTPALLFCVTLVLLLESVGAVCAWTRVVVPLSKPVTAAVRTSALTEFFMVSDFSLCA